MTTQKNIPDPKTVNYDRVKTNYVECSHRHDRVNNPPHCQPNFQPQPTGNGGLSRGEEGVGGECADEPLEVGEDKLEGARPLVRLVGRELDG